MLTLVFGMLVSKGKVNSSLDLCLITKETTGDCEQGFVFKHVYSNKGGGGWVLGSNYTCMYENSIKKTRIKPIETTV